MHESLGLRTVWERTRYTATFPFDLTVITNPNSGEPCLVRRDWHARD